MLGLLWDAAVTNNLKENESVGKHINVFPIRPQLLATCCRMRGAHFHKAMETPYFARVIQKDLSKSDN